MRKTKLEVGQKAPDFTVVSTDLKEVTLADSAGKIRLISVVPSLDTRLCNMQTHRFNDEASSFGDDVVVLTVSADLPYAQKRWAEDEDVENVQLLSTHRDMQFADAYGVYNTDLRLCRRSVFIVDQDDTIRYAEYVPEGGREVNFEGALSALKEVVS